MEAAFINRKTAHVDLTRGEVWVRPIPMKARRMLLGGRGINMLALLKYARPGLDPLSPEAPLIIGNGLLSGVPGISLARTSITGISPESGLLGDSNIGGRFCAAMRGTSFDHLLITGELKVPGIVVLQGDSATIQDGAWLWGQDAFETYESLKVHFGPSAEALVIGPGGENLVRFAQVRSLGRHAASRTGLGCTMGAKRLKAIVAIGLRHNQLDDLFDRQGYIELIKRLQKIVLAVDVAKHLGKRGTSFLYDIHSRMGLIRTKNATSASLPNANALRSAKLISDFYAKRDGCFSCQVRCQHSFMVREGKYAGTRGAGIEYGTLGSLGPVLGIADPAAVLAINHKLNRLGIDSCTVGNLLGAAIELFQKGIITEQDTGGLRLGWGDDDMVLQIIDQIARRQGFGDVLAGGPRAFCERYGAAAEDAMIWSKMLIQSDPVDVRAYAGFALGVATSTRGADHLRSRPTFEALGLSKKELRAIYGEDVGDAPGSTLGKARMVRHSEGRYAVCDAIGMCRFLVKFNSPDLLGLKELAELIHHSTGLTFSVSELEDVGHRISTIERLWLAGRGAAAQDALPKRYFEPMPGGKFKGHSMSQEDFERMLLEFRSISGLDGTTGAPLAARLRELGIDDELLDLI